MSDRQAGHSRILAELGHIDRELDLVRQLNSLRADRPLVRLELHGAASTLHSIYTGIERCLLIAVRTAGRPDPTGADWHQELLRIAIAAQLIDDSLARRLRELLGFRHFYRHAYGFMLDGDLLAPLLDDIEGLVADVKSALPGV